MIKSLNHAALPAFDLNRALSFYKDQLGFVDYHVSDQDWAMLRLNDSTLSLVLDKKIGDRAKVIQKGNPSHLGITVTDKKEVDSMYEKLSQRRDILVAPIKLHRDQSYGFYFLDTEGNQLEFIYIPLLPELDKSQEKKSIILLAHGSSSEGWKQKIKDLVSLLNKESLRHSWSLAFLEGEELRLEDVCLSLKNEGKSKLFLVPYFLSTGRHVRVDIPILVKDVLKKIDDIEIKVLKSLGEDPLFQSEIISYLERSVEEGIGV